MSATSQPYLPRYLGPSFEDARVHDAMRVGIVTCHPDTSLRDAARIMVGYQVHSLLVGDAASRDGKFRLLTDLDVVKAATGDPTELTAGELANSELLTVPADEPLAGAAKLMAEHECAHLLAVQPDTGHPVGVISALGLASVIAAARG
jgi:CBS domain-containing protein